MLAAEINTKKYRVTLYEKKKAVGRKFLVAGEGGLNLTYNSALEEFIAQYFPSEFMDSIIRGFTNKNLVDWLKDLGIVTFIGSSNRVFPDPELKPVDVLNRITKYILSKNVSFQFNSNWLGWSKEGSLRFEDQADVSADIVVFALGGASWKVTGSDGSWDKVFAAKGIQVEKFRAANCAFGVKWDRNFIDTHEGKPLKNIALTCKGTRSTGELVISKFGLEGNAIYPLSRHLQDELFLNRVCKIYLDIKPILTLDQIRLKFEKSKFTKITDILKKDINLDRTAIAILKQCSTKETFLNPDLLSKKIKSLPITIHSADELDKAISTLGGLSLDEVDHNFQLKKIPNSYAVGEMLDWYAPTGGYLLQGCFSIGFALAQHLNELEK